MTRSLYLTVVVFPLRCDKITLYLTVLVFPLRRDKITPYLTVLVLPLRCDKITFYLTVLDRPCFSWEVKSEFITFPAYGIAYDTR